MLPVDKMVFDHGCDLTYDLLTAKSKWFIYVPSALKLLIWLYSPEQFIKYRIDKDALMGGRRD